MTQKKTNPMEQYLRILTSGLAGQEDYAAGVELINAGYATGKPLIERSRSNDGYVRELLQFQVTVQGRLFAEELKRHTVGAKLRSLIEMALLAVVSAAFGIGVVLVEKSLIGC